MTQQTSDTAILDRLRDVVDSASAGRVFGEPISHGGVVVLPAAKVSGGAGGGTGPADSEVKPSGTGGGFGMSAKALGVFVIHDGGKVQWQPAVDVNRIVMGGQIVAVAALLLARAVITARRAGGKRRRTAPVAARMRGPKRHRH
jgi:uncharacterized spore protein YtfJ